VDERGNVRLTAHAIRCPIGVIHKPREASRTRGTREEEDLAQEASLKADGRTEARGLPLSGCHTRYHKPTSQKSSERKREEKYGLGVLDFVLPAGKARASRWKPRNSDPIALNRAQGRGGCEDAAGKDRRSVIHAQHASGSRSGTTRSEYRREACQAQR